MFAELKGQGMRNALATMTLHEKAVSLLWLFLLRRKTVTGHMSYLTKQAYALMGRSMLWVNETSQFPSLQDFSEP